VEAAMAFGLTWVVVRVDDDGLSLTSTMTQTFGRNGRCMALPIAVLEDM